MSDACGATIHTKVLRLEVLETGRSWPGQASEPCVLTQRACMNPLSFRVLLSCTSCDIYLGATVPSHTPSSMYLHTGSR